MSETDQLTALAKRLQMKVNSLSERADMHPDNPEYQQYSEALNKVNRSLNEQHSEQRNTDAAGKLLSEAPSVSPNSVGGGKDSGGFNFHFEPSVAEARRALSSDPQLAQRLGLSDWMRGVARPAGQEPVADPATGQVIGQNDVPLQTHLDTMDENSSAYKSYAEDLWQQKMQAAQEQGQSLQRYKNVKLKEQPLHYLAGGAEKVGERYAAPAALGAADSFSMGQASPLLDAATDLTDYELSKRGVNTDFLPAHSADIIARSPGSYIAGNLAGYGAAGNPLNLATEGLMSAANYAGRGALGKAAISGAIGAGVNTAAGAVGDFSRALGEGKGVGESAGEAAQNAPLNTFFGGAGGLVGDLAGQGVGLVRQGYRDMERNRPLRTLEQAGGGTSMGWNSIVGTPEIDAYVHAARQPDAHFSAGGLAAEQVAPDIERSVTKQATDEQSKIRGQMEDYFNHPAYANIEADSKPLVEALAGLAKPGAFRSPLTGELRNVDPTVIKSIGKEISNLSEVTFVPAAEAPRVAHERGGTVIDTDLARQLFSAGDGSEIPAGSVAVAVGAPLNAQRLTELEKRIYRELGINNVRTAGNEDPVFETLDRATKQVRDQFPYYQDEAGNLVAPPAATQSQAPFAPAGDRPMPPDRSGDGGVTVLPPPRVLGEGGPQRAPEGLLGVGPGQPALPESPFDPRAAREPQTPLQAMAAPQPVVGSPEPVARPQGLLGVGPGQPELPNPFDPRLPTSREAIGAQPPPAEVGTPPMERSPTTERGPGRVQGESQFDKNSLPAPTATEYGENAKELGNWYDNIVTPGAEARSGEAKRMGDLTEQRQAFDDAEGQIRNAEDRLGKMAPEDREKNLLRLLSQKLGREVTKEDLIKAGLIAGAGVAAVTSNDDDTKAAAGVGGLAAIIGKPHFESLSKEAKTAVSELSFLKPANLKKPESVAALAEYINSTPGISALEAHELNNAIEEFHKSYVSSLPEMENPKKGKPNIWGEGYGADRNIGKSLTLGQRFSGDIYAADALIKKEKKELGPPPPEKPFKKTTRVRSDPESRLPADPAVRQLIKVSKRAYDELPEDEQQAVDMWTGQSRAIRSEQRNGIPLYREGAMAPKFESAVDKLMIVDPTKHGPLYRHFSAEPAELAELLQNNQFEVGAHMSSSYEPLETFGPHELRITKADRAGALIGENPSESEMIIPEGSRFKVTNRWYNPEKSGFVFELREVPVTKENLMDKVGYLAVPAGAGIGAALSGDDDKDGNGAALGAVLGGMGSGHLSKGPRQLEATLEDGTKVKGFSALRRNQHTEQEAIEQAKKRIGVGKQETVESRIRTFGQHEDRKAVDDALLNEAQKIGKEKELRTAAGAAVYQSLKDQSSMMGAKNWFQVAANPASKRLEKFSELLSGGFVPGKGDGNRNPFARAPNSTLGEIQRAMLEDPARRLLNLTGGRVGARYGDDFRKIYEELQRQDDDRKKNDEQSP